MADTITATHTGMLADAVVSAKAWAKGGSDGESWKAKIKGIVKLSGGR